MMEKNNQYDSENYNNIPFKKKNKIWFAVIAVVLIIAVGACVGSYVGSYFVMSSMLEKRENGSVSENYQGNIANTASESKTDTNKNIESKGKNIDSSEMKVDNELVIGYTNYEPFAYFESDNNLIGFDIELAKYVCEELDLSPTFVEINWDERVLLLNSNAIDCVWNGVVLTENAQESMSVSDIYLYYEVRYDGYSTTEPLIVGFKKDSELVSRVNSAISKAKQNGVIDSLINKYIK